MCSLKPGLRLALNTWTKRICLLLGAAVAAALFTSCDRDEIRTYRAPRDETAPAGKPNQRLLAAILPHGERTWFFKLMGPAQEVEQYKGAFDRFIKSVRFSDQKEPPVTWTAPDGWRQEAGSAMRYAGFRPAAKESEAELTVVALGRDAGSTLANVNRWRGQIGLKPIDEGELGKVCKEEKIDGVTATLVDMTGQGAMPDRKFPPLAAGRTTPNVGEAGSRSQGPLRYAAPAGWKEVSDSGGMRVAAFEVSEGAQRAEVTIVPLAGQAGGSLENIKRWRGQLKLEPVGDDQLQKEIRQLQVDGEAAQYVDLVGPESAGRERERILAVIVVRGDQTWFFKMKGPAELVGKQKPAFEAFVKSVRFGAGQE
jgi:hypothetical protein